MPSRGQTTSTPRAGRKTWLPQKKVTKEVKALTERDREKNI